MNGCIIEDKEATNMFKKILAKFFPKMKCVWLAIGCETSDNHSLWDVTEETADTIKVRRLHPTEPLGTSYIELELNVYDPRILTAVFYG